jgi:hypothetical protein
MISTESGGDVLRQGFSSRTGGQWHRRIATLLLVLPLAWRWCLSLGIPVQVDSDGSASMFGCGPPDVGGRGAWAVGIPLNLLLPISCRTNSTNRPVARDMELSDIPVSARSGHRGAAPAATCVDLGSSAHLAAPRLRSRLCICSTSVSRLMARRAVSSRPTQNCTRFSDMTSSV